MHEKIFFKNRTGDKLSGIISNPSNSTEKPIILLIHGLFSSKESTTYTSFEKAFNHIGFSTLRIDAYGHGESEGKLEDFTITEMKEDLLQALEFLKKKGYHKIGLVGSSSGGIAIILAAAESRNLYVLILIAPVSVHNGQLILHKKKNITKAMWKEKGFIIYPLKNGSKVKLGYQFLKDDDNYDGFQAARKIKIPTFIIHGDKDDSVPLKDSRKLASLLPKSILKIVKAADHYFSDSTHFALRQKMIVAFIRKNS